MLPEELESVIREYLSLFHEGGGNERYHLMNFLKWYENVYSAHHPTRQCECRVCKKSFQLD